MQQRERAVHLPEYLHAAIARQVDQIAVALVWAADHQTRRAAVHAHGRGHVVVLPRRAVAQQRHARSPGRIDHEPPVLHTDAAIRRRVQIDRPAAVDVA